MKKVLGLFTMMSSAVALAAPATRYVDGWMPRTGDFGLYYSYANQKFQGAPTNPGGSGVGVVLRKDLPNNLFVDALYESNVEHAAAFSQGGFDFPGVRSMNDQVRAGGGIQFFVPQQPLTLYGKVDYVHYGFHEKVGSEEFFANNDDGVGYFLGFRTTGPGLNVYAQGGQLELADTRGQEGSGGVSFPIGRVDAYGLPVNFFIEYRWTHLEEDNGAHDIYYNYHAGLNFPLRR
jgi:hypothetical protein